MWDLFDFNNDGETSLFEKVVGLELLNSTSQGEDTTMDDSASDDGELVGDDSDEFDEDDEDFDEDDDDFEDEDEF